MTPDAAVLAAEEKVDAAIVEAQEAVRLLEQASPRTDRTSLALPYANASLKSLRIAKRRLGGDYS